MSCVEWIHSILTDVQIYGWMKRVADNPEHYGAESNTELESKKKMLAEIRQEIILLR